MIGVSLFSNVAMAGSTAPWGTTEGTGAEKTLSSSLSEAKEPGEEESEDEREASERAANSSGLMAASGGFGVEIVILTVVSEKENVFGFGRDCVKRKEDAGAFFEEEALVLEKWLAFLFG